MKDENQNDTTPEVADNQEPENGGEPEVNQESVSTPDPEPVKAIATNGAPEVAKLGVLTSTSTTTFNQ